MPVFLAPWFLLASAAAAIPVAIHLLHRRRPRPVPFSTLRFIREAVARTRRSRHLTHVLALLMRVLILLLLAAAFSRPKVHFTEWLPAGRRTVVIMLDASASMQYREGESTLFARGRRWAVQLVRSLEEGDRVAVVAPGLADPWVVFPAHSDRQAVLRALDDLSPGFGRVQLVAAFREVLARLGEDAERTGVEFHLFSDFQQAAWDGSEAEELGVRFREEELQVFLNRLTPAVAANAAIARAAFYPPALLGDGSFEVNVDVTASAEYTGENSVRLDVAGEEQARETFPLRPAERVTQRLEGSAGGEETHVQGRLELDTDALAADNVYRFSLPRLPGIPILLVDGSARGEKGSRDTFFLRYAIQPRGKARTLFLSRVVDWVTFAGSDPSEFRVVYLCNPPRLDEAVRRKLRRYAEAGGTVVVLPGENGALQAAAGTLPGLEGLTARKEELEQEASFSVVASERPQEFERRLTSLLPSLPSVVVRRRLVLDALPESGCSVFRYGDGAPFAVSVPLGQGRLWLGSVSANRDWSEWPLSPFFVVFHQELIKGAARRTLAAGQGVVGERLALSWPGDATEFDFQVTTPGGERRLVAAERSRPGEPVVLPAFTETGHYRVAAGDDVRVIAVNVPPTESELTYVSREEIDLAFRASGVHQSEDWHRHQEQLADLRHGRPLWPVLLLLAFLLGATEEIFSNVRSRAGELPAALQQFLRRGQGAA